MQPNRADLEAEAAALEARLARFRAWYHAQAATMEALSAQIAAQRERIDRGTRKADALSSRLTAIRLQLQAATSDTI